METSEIVRRLLSRPVTSQRALRMLHLLENQSQLAEVQYQAPEDARAILESTLTDSVVERHFATRGR